MTNLQIAMIVAVVPALYIMWRVRAVFYQDRVKAGPAVGMALVAGAIVWGLAFGPLWVLGLR